MPDDYIADPTRPLVERIQSDLNRVASCLPPEQDEQKPIDDPERIKAMKAALTRARDDVKLLLGKPERPEPRRGLPARRRRSENEWE